MRGRTVAVGLIATSLVLATAGAASARLDRPSVGCPEGGVTLSLVIWQGSVNDGTGSTFIRRLKIDNECAEYALVWFSVDQTAPAVSSLLVPPLTSGVLDRTELADLGWNVSAPAWRLWIDAEAGATNDHFYCSWSSTVPAPQFQLQSRSLASFSCA